MAPDTAPAMAMTATPYTAMATATAVAPAPGVSYKRRGNRSSMIGHNPTQMFSYNSYMLNFAGVPYI